MVQLKESNIKEKGSAIIIGASLSGLMTALALSEEGIRVTVLEKSKQAMSSGASLKVEGYSDKQGRMEKKLKDIISEGKTSVQLWSSIEERLRKEAMKTATITLNYDSRVISIGQDEKSAWAKTEKGHLFQADILIGADGHRSLVRKEIDPHHPHAEFAGYLVWMATFDREELEEDKRPDPNKEQVKIYNSNEGFLFGSVIETEDNKMKIACTWYDNTQTDLLYRMGAVRGKFVHHSIQGSDIGQEDLKILANQARKDWPEPWATAILHAITSRSFIGVPIKEYIPRKLVRGRFTMVGDAAHVPSPITTSGFNDSLKDAAALNKSLGQGLQGPQANKALKEYEALRLEKMQEMVESGRPFSREFARY